MLQSFDFGTLNERQVLELFRIYLQESNSALDIFIGNGLNYRAGTNNKYEWLESTLKPKSWKVNASSVAGAFDTAADMTFLDTTGMEVGMIIRFVDANGYDKGDMQVKVTEVKSATVATVVVYGGTTGVALDNTCVAKFLSEPVKENEKGIEGKSKFLPTTEHNFFQIFRDSAELSDTALNSAVYGDVNDLGTQLQAAFYSIRQQMSEQIVRGRRVARSATEHGSFGGFLQFIQAAGGLSVDAGSEDLTPALLNQAIELVYGKGGMVNTIVCNVNQARKFASFNRDGSTGSNVYTMLSEKTKDVGGYALRFISDIPLAGGIVSNILIDDKMPIDKVELIDINNIAAVPYENRGLKIVDGTQNGQDGTTAIIRWEYSLVCKDSKSSAVEIKGLLK